MNLRLKEIGVVNDNGIKISISDEKTENAINLKDLEVKKVEEKKVVFGGKSSWPPPRIIIGAIDPLLLAAAIVTFVLFFLPNFSVSIVYPIVLAVLFVIDTVVFFRWNSLLPKILTKSCIKKLNFRTGSFSKSKGINKTEKRNIPKEETKENKLIEKI